MKQRIQPEPKLLEVELNHVGMGKVVLDGIDLSANVNRLQVESSPEGFTIVTLRLTNLNVKGQFKVSDTRVETEW